MFLFQEKLYSCRVFLESYFQHILEIRFPIFGLKQILKSKLIYYWENISWSIIKNYRELYKGNNLFIKFIVYAKVLFLKTLNSFLPQCR